MVILEALILVWNTHSNMIKNLIQNLSIKEKSGKKIGVFRTLLAIFGGLLVAYTSMTLLVFILPAKNEEALIISLLFNTLVWSSVALWILLSTSKLIALLKVFIPTTIFLILITIFYNI